MTLHCTNNGNGKTALTVLALAALCGVACAAPEEIVLKVRAVHVGDGRIISPGVVVVRDGRIASVGAQVPAPGATVIELPDACITPGLIDAKAVIDNYDLMPTPTSSLRMAERGASRLPGGAEGKGRSASTDTSSHDDAAAGLGAWLTGAAPGVGNGGAHEHVASAQNRLEAGFGYASADAHMEAGLAEDRRLPCCGEIAPGVFASAPTMASPLASGVRDGMSESEHSWEVVPHTRVLDAVDLKSPDLARLLAGGVTTIFIGGDSDAVIGAQGAVVRTAGPLEERVVLGASDVAAAMGSDPLGGRSWNRPPWGGNVDIYTRRPTTRMGVAWVFRKAFYDAQRWASKTPTHGADTPPEAAMPFLMSILKGETPLRIQARRQNDIETALRLAEEFKLMFTLEEGTESYLCVEALRARSVPVVYGPIYEEARGPRAWRGESQNARLHTFRALLDAGINTALTAQELRDEDGLARQAMYAIRFGVDPKRVLESVTLTPARLLRVDKEVGSVEAGKRADLVVWSGEPFAATTRPLMVLAAGRIEADRRMK